MPRPLLTGIPGRLAAASRWRRVGPAIAAIAVVAIVVGVLVGAGLPGSSRGASPARKASGGTATVQRRDLVATDTVAGTLSYATPRTVFNRTSGTVTALPAVGAVVKPGQRLYDVNGSPVILFDGTVPAYRDLAAGVADGPDVQELKQNLVNLGFDPSHQIKVNQTFDSATTTAVDAWQASLAETQTGSVTLGKIVFLPGVQRITAVDAVLGSTGSGAGSSASGGGSSPGSTSSTSTTGASNTISAQARTEFASYTKTIPAQTSTGSSSATTSACPPTTTSTLTTTTPTTPTGSCPTTTTPATTPTKRKTGTTGRAPTAQQLLAELVAALKKLAGSSSTAARGGSSAAGAAAGAAATGRSSGGGGGASGAATGGASGGASSAAAGSGASTGSATGTAQAILQTTSNEVVVSVQLDATKQSEAVVNAPVTVQLPDGSTVTGKITQVSPVAQSSSAGSSSGAAGGAASSTPTATIPVTIAITGRQPAGGLDQAAVSVNFEQQVERNVLSVPVTALLATAGGHYAVQEAQAPHSLLSVSPGLFAAGYVQVDGPQIYPGLQVTDSQG